MNPRWLVRKWRNYGLATGISVWEVYEPDGTFSREFGTWHQGSDGATNPIKRLEHWLEGQP